MTAARLVALDVRATDAFGLEDIHALPVGAVVVNAGGVIVRVQPGGQLDPWPSLGHRSIASDPTARRL